MMASENYIVYRYYNPNNFSEKETIYENAIWLMRLWSKIIHAQDARNLK